MSLQVHDFTMILLNDSSSTFQQAISNHSKADIPQ